MFIQEHVLPADWNNSLTFLGNIVIDKPWAAMKLTNIGSSIIYKARFTTALSNGSIPLHSLRTNRLFTFSSYPIENGISWVTTTGVIMNIVSLMGRTFIDTILVDKVIDLPSMTVSIFRRTFLKVDIPSLSLFACRNLTNSQSSIKERLICKTLTRIVIFEVCVLLFTTNLTVLLGKVIKLPGLAVSIH